MDRNYYSLAERFFALTFVVILLGLSACSSSGDDSPTPDNTPTADAGPAQNILLGETVQLDGSGSTGSGTLDYTWSLTTRPNASGSVLSNASTINPSFVADVSGTYIVQLIVSNGNKSSAPDTVTITATEPQHVVPDVVGQSQAAAETAITSAGLSLGTVTQQSSATVPTGIIISQTPSAGSSVASGSAITLVISSGAPSSGLPEDPATIAPKLDPAQSISLQQASAFLYSGSNPIQTGVAADTIEIKRAAVLRGKVLSRNDTPLSGVTISIKNHPEFGQTQSRVDGLFDMAINGGGLLTVNYQKEGYLPIQRQLTTPWNDYAHPDDVIMIPLDAQATTIDLTNTTLPFQVAQGNPVTDSEGTRQATLLFPQGTTATMTLPNGSTQPLTTLNVRATEYTVGDNGPAAMPGPLPASSAYTYAVELSVDEAIAAGATRVDFDQTVPVYVDNFLEFPVGEIVPAGWYDREKSAWVPSDDGLVIGILAITGGIAELDLDGSGTVANATQLAALGITDAERARLATLYTAGKSLWRTPITHFTPWDYNWPWRPPSDAKPPRRPTPKEPPPDEDEDECDGCIIQPQSQSLGEKLPVTGTPFSLYYQSERMPGNISARTLTIPLSDDTVPGSLQGIELTIEIAGQRQQYSFPATPNQSHTFIWDGKDAYGRPLHAADATISLDYRYQLVYFEADRDSFSSAFAQPASGGATIIGTRGDQTMRSRQQWQQTLTGIATAPNLASSALGDWGLDIHHTYDSASGMLYKGDGSLRSAADLSQMITTVAGPGSSVIGDGGPAELARIAPFDTTVGPDGSLYIADNANHRVRRVSPEGIITTIAGTGEQGYSGDGGPANQAQLSSPIDVALDPDGNLYIADYYNNHIRRVSPEGIITTIVGTGELGYSGDGGPATQARLNQPVGLAFASDGSLYITDTGNNRIRRVNPEGIITTVAGTEMRGDSGDGGPANQASLSYPINIAFGPNGNLYIADTDNERIRQVSSDGIITAAAGSGIWGYSGDGGPANQARLDWPTGITFSPDGSFYIADWVNQNIRQVAPNGIITTVAGTGTAGNLGDGGAADQAQLSNPKSITFGPDGALYISTSDRIRRMGLPLPSIEENEYLIPSTTSNQLFQFTSNGRHLRTLDSVTGAVMYQFRYDTEGLLSEIEDVGGNITRIERSGETPVAIIAPDGQRSSLTLDTEGYLATLIDPAGDAWQMAYTTDGLMTTFTDRNGNRTDFTFDASGRLIEDSNPIGGGWQLERTEIAEGYAVTLTSGEGHTRTFQVEHLPDGTRRQTNTARDGSVAITEFNKAVTTTISANGTISTAIEGPDPRFDMQRPLISKRITITPSGLEQTVEETREATMENNADLLSHSSLTETITVNGNSTTNTYDAATRTWSLTTEENRTASRTLTEQGKTASIQTPSRADIHYAYDLRGRLESISQGSGMEARQTSISYDTNGHIENITDALGRTLGFNYDAVGRITHQQQHDGRTIAYTYDANGNLTSITPPGKPAHRFNYTPVDLEDNYTPPSLGTGSWATQYTYNLDKELSKIERPDGQVVDFNYHPTSAKLDNISTLRGQTQYAYHPTSGQLATITTPDGDTLDFNHDGFLPLATTWAGSINGTVSRGYDNNFWLTSLTVNSSTIGFGYDRDGLLTQAGEMTLTHHLQNGQLTDTALNSVSTNQSYNPFGEITTLSASYSSNALFDVSYTRDKLGRITHKTESIQGEASATYQYFYDEAGRLTGVEKDNIAVSRYDYDPNGNRNGGFNHQGNITTTIDPQDRLLTYNDTHYTYTANGELYAKEQNGVITTYDYDLYGNLMQVILPGDITLDYLIDGQNRRIGKKVNGVLTQGFLYQDQLNPVAELDGNGQVISQFVYASKGNVPDYMLKAGITYRIISDHLGSPRLIVNTTDGSIAQQIDYDEFGIITHDTNPGFQPFGFAGGIYDQHTQLTRFGARDYDAQIGRWTAKDPIGFAGGDSNLYGYVVNNPINFIDPYGLNPAAGAIGGGMIAGPPGAVVGGVIGFGIGLYLGDKMFSEARNKSRESKPKNCPSGTKPIDKIPGLDKDKIHGIKDGVLARPRDWTGITPNGDVITSDSDGNAINHGPFGGYLP